MKEGVRFVTRKEMIEEIARQAECSKRTVRKKLFSRSAELKRHHKEFKFNEAFLNPNTDWIDKNILEHNWRNGKRDINPWNTPDTFDVGFFPSGCVVLFNVKCIDNDGYQHIDTIGTRLYMW